MTAAAAKLAPAMLPRFWPPQNWRMRQRLQDPAEALWSELRMARGEIEVIDLMARAIDHCEAAFANRGDGFRRFDALLDDWIARGLVSAAGHPLRYRLSKEYIPLRSPPTPPAPRRNPFPKRTQRQRLWQAMRVLRSFDLPTLMMTANVQRPAAMELIGILTRGGWLRRTATGWSTGGARPWASVAPTISRIDGPQGACIRVTDAMGEVVDLPVRTQRRPHRSERSAASSLEGGVS